MTSLMDDIDMVGVQPFTFEQKRAVQALIERAADEAHARGFMGGTHIQVAVQRQTGCPAGGAVCEKPDGVTDAIQLIRDMREREQQKRPSQSARTRWARKARLSSYDHIERRLIAVLRRRTRVTLNRDLTTELEALCL